MVWMYNTECKFDDKGELKFGELKWIVPIEAITKIELVDYAKSQQLEMKIHINSKC